MTVGVEKLANLAAGDTVRARYRTEYEPVEVCGRVFEDSMSGYFNIILPGPEGTRGVPLRQISNTTTPEILLEVVSVTKPPYAQGATESEPKPGDVVEAGPLYGDGALPRAQRWMYCPSAAIPNDRLEKVCEWLLIQGDGMRWWARDQLPERLRLVQRLQDWPVIDRKWDSDEEFAEQFARAQRMMATKIRGLRSAGNVDHNSALDEAARLVESFDLDDAYPGDD